LKKTNGFSGVVLSCGVRSRNKLQTSGLVEEIIEKYPGNINERGPEIVFLVDPVDAGIISMTLSWLTSMGALVVN
jgi:hypothetical protein